MRSTTTADRRPSPYSSMISAPEAEPLDDQLLYLSTGEGQRQHITGTRRHLYFGGFYAKFRHWLIICIIFVVVHVVHNLTPPPPPLKLLQGCGPDLLHSRSYRSIQVACRTQPAIVIAAFEGIQDAMAQCADRMRFQQWDCSNVGHIMHDPPILKYGYRESALIWALSSAGAAWGVATACAQGWIDDCSCAHDGQPGWEYGGCSFSVQHGITASRKLLTKTPVVRTPLRSVEKHNLKAGRLTLIASCKCHGVSGSCQQKTCWKKTATLDHITDYLVEKYARARMLVGDQKAKNADLVFIELSPDPCQQQTTSGRVCAWRNETHTQGDCARLCCGKGFKITHEVIHYKCDCKNEARRSIATSLTKHNRVAGFTKSTMNGSKAPVNTAEKKQDADKDSKKKARARRKKTTQKEPKAAPKNSSARQVSDASGDSSSEDSEEIIVYETPENQSYERKVVIGHLSRVGFREPFWRDKVAAFFVILSYLITYDIVAHFFLFTHVFGISWTFTYGFCMLFIGFPMCYLEMALGQYTSTGVFMVFDRITPAFVGVGISALLINFFAASMDQGLFVNALSIIRETVQILTSEMPWHHCLSTHGMKYCHVWSRECSRLTKQIAIPQYPKRLIYKGGKEFEFVLKGDTCVRPPLRSLYTGLNDIAPKTELDKFKTASMVNWANSEVHDFDSFKQYTYLSPTSIFYTMLFILICIFIVSRSRRAVVIFLNVSLVLTFCVLSFLLHGMFVIFSPKFPYAVPTTVGWIEAIKGIGPWMCAISLTMRSLKLGQGGMVFLGSQNGFHNNLITDCLLITIAMIFVPFFYSMFHIIAIDSYVLEILQGDPNKMDTAARLRKQGTYHNPATIATILLNANHIFGEYEPIVTFWYSIIMISTVISSKIVRYEITIGAFVENYAIFTDESSRFVLIVIVVLFTTLLSFAFKYTDGYIRAASINFTVIPIASSVVVLCELFVVGIFYGFRVFYSNTSLMIFGAAKTEAKKLKLLVNSMALVLWTVVIPVAILFSIVALIIYDARSDFTALDIYNWILLSAILLPIPAMCIYLMYCQHSQGNSIYPLFKRNPDLWGPRTRANRIEAERAERMIRKWW
ncbi:hypothetical protein RB195_004079 [Necator americanus]|uniref:Protein Wnt n=1 Tax=Necator americanus TaxID=51031 RepID=A0ABR1BJT1_NECAM